MWIFVLTTSLEQSLAVKDNTYWLAAKVDFYNPKWKPSYFSGPRHFLDVVVKMVVIPCSTYT